MRCRGKASAPRMKFSSFRFFGSFFIESLEYGLLRPNLLGTLPSVRGIQSRDAFFTTSSSLNFSVIYREGRSKPSGFLFSSDPTVSPPLPSFLSKDSGRSLGICSGRFPGRRIDIRAACRPRFPRNTVPLLNCAIPEPLACRLVSSLVRLYYSVLCVICQHVFYNFSKIFFDTR